MKKIAKILTAVMICTVLCFAGLINSSAEKYTKNVVSCNFENSDCEFLKPGDYDADGTIDNEDFAAFKSLILKIGTDTDYASVFSDNNDAVYSDANGDGVIDIRDLVLSSENESADFISNGSLKLNGNSAYGGEFLKKLGTGAQYRIKYSYNEDDNVTVKINGINMLEDDTVSTTSENIVTVSRTVKTPLTINDVSGIALQLVGEGEITEFSVTRINMDNEIADKTDW